MSGVTFPFQSAAFCNRTPQKRIRGSSRAAASRALIPRYPVYGISPPASGQPVAPPSRELLPEYGADDGRDELQPDLRGVEVEIQLEELRDEHGDEDAGVIILSSGRYQGQQ